MTKTKKLIGIRLDDEIRSRGWSREAFALRVGIQAHRVSGYLTGKYDPLALLGKLKQLGFDVAYIQNGRK
jgi:transcriptional regulator with XRE-family HTH domain